MLNGRDCNTLAVTAQPDIRQQPGFDFADKFVSEGHLRRTASNQLWRPRKTRTDTILVRARDEQLLLPLHHQMRPWAMKAGVAPLNRSADNPQARYTPVKKGIVSRADHRPGAA